MIVAYQLYLIRMVIFKNTKINAGEDLETEKFLYIGNRNLNLYRYYKKQGGGFSKN